MKEKILKDIGESVVIADIYNNTLEMTGIISMITVTQKGIKYRAKFNGNSISKSSHQQDFWQDEIVR